MTYDPQHQRHRTRTGGAGIPLRSDREVAHCGGRNLVVSAVANPTHHICRCYHRRVPISVHLGAMRPRADTRTPTAGVRSELGNEQ